MSFLYNSDAAFDAGDCGNLHLSDFISAEQDGTLPYAPCTFNNGIDDDGDLLIDEPGILTSYPLSRSRTLPLARYACSTPAAGP